ncbi:hypothetical protein WCP94_000636 (plasmid) [Bilophila wadsworthia]
MPYSFTPHLSTIKPRYFGVPLPLPPFFQQTSTRRINPERKTAVRPPVQGG